MQLSTISLALTRLGGLFSPAALFAGGTVAGAWYDPSDLSTMFDTSAGTTPVAMPGQGAAVPVGLMLDKSQGLVLGPELITPAANRDFSSNTGYWTIAGNITITGGQAVYTSANSLNGIYRTGFTTAGTYYEVTFTVGSITAGALRVYAGGNRTANVTTAGTYTQRVVAGSTDTLFIFECFGTTTLTLDDVSVKVVSGNHAIAANDSTKRPVLMARVNLLEYSEQFDNAYWTKATLNVINAAGAAPNGTNTANKVYTTTTGAYRGFSRQITTTAISYVATIFAKAAEKNIVGIVDLNGGAGAAWFNLSTGVASNVAPGYVAAITSAGNGWYQCSITGTASAGTGYYQIFIADAAGGITATVNGTDGVLLWGADLRPANIGANVPAYQRIADALTYDTSGFPLYLRFDGIDDSMYTPASIPFATVTSDGQARRNLLSFPTVFNDPFWTVSGTTVSANSTTAPDGTTTADTLTETAAAGSHQIYNTSQLMGVPTPLCMSVYVKPNGRTWVFLGDDGGGVFFNLIGAGSVGTQQAGRTGSISSVGDGWYRVVVTGNRPAVNDSVYIALCSADNTLSYTGNGTSGVFIWGAQFEAGSTATAFQNIGTDKVSVFAGVRKLSSSINFYSELTTDAFTLAGGFYISSSSNVYAFVTQGSFYEPSGYVPPISNVLACSYDLSKTTLATEIIPRINGVVTQTGGSGSGSATGNFANAPLFIGARNNASFFLNGHLHSLIIAGSAVSAGNISATEQWVAGKTGIAI